MTGLLTDVGHERVASKRDSVIIDSAGYESSKYKRAWYYGSEYDDMKIRGSRYNTGDVSTTALDADENAVGQWSGTYVIIIEPAHRMSKAVPTAPTASSTGSSSTSTVSTSSTVANDRDAHA
jgi:hypothetical protein